MARQGLFDKHSLDSLKYFIQDDRLGRFNTLDMRWIGSQRDRQMRFIEHLIPC